MARSLCLMNVVRHVASERFTCAIVFGTEKDILNCKKPPGRQWQTTPSELRGWKARGLYPLKMVEGLKRRKMKKILLIIAEWWLQIHCCGVTSKLDWTRSSGLPASCCEEKYSNSCRPEHAYGEGCLTKGVRLVVDKVKRYMWIVGGIIGVEVRLTPNAGILEQKMRSNYSFGHNGLLFNGHGAQVHHEEVPKPPSLESPKCKHKYPLPRVFSPQFVKYCSCQNHVSNKNHCRPISRGKYFVYVFRICLRAARESWFKITR